jgi:hypothetical protein
MVNARDEDGNVLYQDRDERVVDNVWHMVGIWAVWRWLARATRC